jgi:hypothetical protein
MEVEPRIPAKRVNATIDAFNVLDAVSMRVMTRIACTPNRRARDMETREGCSFESFNK